MPLRHLSLLSLMLFAIALFPQTSAAEEAAAGNAASIPPGRSHVPGEPANIAPTVATMSNERVVVFGKPRVATNHPNTLWDQEDIDHYKEMLKSSKELQVQFADLKARMDERISNRSISLRHKKALTAPGSIPANTFLHSREAQLATIA